MCSTILFLDVGAEVSNGSSLPEVNDPCVLSWIWCRTAGNVQGFETAVNRVMTSV